MKFPSGVTLVLLAAAMAPGARGAEQPSGAAFRAAMAAQYAARTPAPAARPEEAQRIYDAYLRRLGQARDEKSAGFANETGQAAPANRSGR